MKRPSLFILFFVIGLSCEQVILGDDQPNTPEENFELLWQDFNDHYALFEIKEVDWNALYSQYRPQVTSSTTDDELWATITEMLDHLDDEHVKIRIPATQHQDFREFASGSAKNIHALDEFSIELIAGKYVEALYQTDDYFSYGTLYGQNIGYIHLIAMLGVNPDVVYKTLSNLGEVDALIVDVRNNIGGKDEYAGGFAGGFSDQETLLYTVETRNGPNYQDFDAPLSVYSHPYKPENFTKPVVLLTDSYTISAGEIFTLNMRAFNHVTHIGDTTAGAHSDVGPARFLPNGWTYEYSIQRYLLPGNISLEGIGIAPEIYIQNTPEDVQNGQDKVLEFAIDFLQNEIE